MQIGRFLSMCDDTGLCQHAVHSVPDRSHGYCVDDNARALLLACALNNPGERPLPEFLTARFAAFVQHAWNPDTKRFRNFMGFNRTWLEDVGSEDSHGRTLWALGECARNDSSSSRRRWAASLFAEALPAAEAFRSPRAWAFTLLGLDAYCAAIPNDLRAGYQACSADRLMAILAAVETPTGCGSRPDFTTTARLPQADVDGPGDHVGLCRCRTKIPALAIDATNDVGRCFPPVGTAGFASSGNVRVPSISSLGSRGNDRGLPYRVAGGR
jgi:hypothetical protein